MLRNIYICVRLCNDFSGLIQILLRSCSHDPKRVCRFRIKRPIAFLYSKTGYYTLYSRNTAGMNCARAEYILGCCNRRSSHGRCYRTGDLWQFGFRTVSWKFVDLGWLGLLGRFHLEGVIDYKTDISFT